ncbi:MAG: CBS domain-containing protein [Betaproteobacteria bacterium]|nr:CBS domain-containing protein [Betaproteobacteria bacterium]
MIIRDILTVKGGDDVFSISPDRPVTEAVKRMVLHDVGSLVVKLNGEMVGLVTERDIMRAMHDRGCDLKDVPVSELMSTEPIIGSPEDTVDYVRGVMTQHRIKHLPVMDGENLLGIISFHDVARACLHEASFENQLLKRYIKHWPE